MKNNEKLRRVVSIISSILGVTLNILFIGVGGHSTHSNLIYNGDLISELIQFLSYLSDIQVIMIGLTLGFLVVSIISSVVAIFNKKASSYLFGLSLALTIGAFLTTNSISNTFQLNFILLFAALPSLLGLVYTITYVLVSKENEGKDIDDTKLFPAIANIIIAILSIVALCIGFFIPVFNLNGTNALSLITGLGNTSSVPITLAFIVYFILVMLCLITTSTALLYIKNNRQVFFRVVRERLYVNFGLSILFYIFCIILLFANSNVSSDTVTTANQYSLGFIPFLINGILIVLQSIFTAKYIVSNNNEHKDYNILNRVIILLFTLMFILVAVGSLLSDIITIDYTASSTTTTITVNGKDLLTNYQDMEAGYQAMAFLVYASLILESVLSVITIAFFFNKSRFYYKSALTTILVSYMLVFALTLFGKYYEIAQKMNAESIESIISSYGISISVSYEYIVKSNALYFFLGDTVLLIILAFIRPFSKHYKDNAIDVNLINEDVLERPAPQDPIENPSLANIDEPKIKNFDACPAFSEIDNKELQYQEDYQYKLNYRFISPTLPEIASFVVDYARNSRLHLSYSVEDIAQFIAGLGATKLSILQGMSGTGKTSLPKIFSEAILGKVDIIEVESSWKDKNELIGYYNEFSQHFTPKKFTQSLYEAKFNPDVITFIVLDEMNLSRIEYYFSDFLSLMENEEDKREIKLLNVKLFNTVNGQDIEYKQLTDGHTLKIPKNVWFIGTANRDESTFEISDKVYDRANTINFNKRAPKVRNYGDPIEKRFVTYEDFNKLLNNAKSSFDFDCETNETIKAVEKLLEPFNISFGNRIAKQIENFVSIYCSCFEDPQNHISDAVERILLSKVVAKLEFKSVENKEDLACQFDKLNLKDCAKFIRKLNEDI